MPTKVFFGQGEMYVPLAFGAVPDAGILRERQTFPRLRAPKRKLAGDACFVIPVSKLFCFVHQSPLSPSKHLLNLVRLLAWCNSVLFPQDNYG